MTDEHYDPAAEEAAVQEYLRQHGMLHQAGLEPGVEDFETRDVAPVTTPATTHLAVPPAPPPTRPTPRQEMPDVHADPAQPAESDEDAQFDAYMARYFPQRA
jgi:hypothetical protein